MKILNIGFGVIGTTYAWQLSEAGYDLTHLVKSNKMDYFKKNGIHITCLDMRKIPQVEVKTIYRPHIVDDFSPIDNYDLIIVSVNSHQLKDILPLLKKKSGKSDILFLQNMRIGEDELIEKYLNSSQYIIGFPFKAGGGRDEEGINTVIFPNIFNHTMLGEKNGMITSRLKRIKKIISAARLKPKITKKTIPYIRTHYIWAASLIGAYLKAGSFENFKDLNIIKESYLAMREVWQICTLQGINPKRVSPTCYFYLPLSILVPLTYLLLYFEGTKRMFEGHLSHSPDEMKIMYYDVLKLGEELCINMPYFKGFKKFADIYFKELTIHGAYHKTMEIQ